MSLENKKQKMNDRIQVSFVVKNKGGLSGGKRLVGDAPAFNWEQFKNAPNAEEFVKKAYLSYVKKIIREIDERKNGTSVSDLASVESVIARSLSFTADEITAWIHARDWNKASQVKDIDKLMPFIKKKLPKLASRHNPFSKDDSDKLADKVIAAVADKPDPVADFLFSVLTLAKESEELLDI